MYKAYIFDLDDTLYYEYEYVKQGFEAVCSYLGEKYILDKEQLFDDMIKILKRQGRGRIFNEICDRYCLQENIENLVHCYRNVVPVLELYRDALQILEWLKEKKCHTGVITDGLASVQHKKIQALSLDKMVDSIIVTDDYGKEYYKPSEKSFLMIADHMDISPADMVYIGDNPQKDFAGARKAGMHTIRIRREKGDHIQDMAQRGMEADRIINTLTELIQ